MSGDNNSAAKNISLVAVYLGGELPKYARKNLLSTKNRFPDADLVLISENENNRGFCDKNGISFYKYNNYEFNYSRIANLISHPINFRNGFWIHTSLRFYALAEFHASNPNTEIIHFELDVILLSNFPINSFRQLEEGVAFPLIAKNEGVASIVYLKKSEHSKRLSEHFQEGFIRNSKATDMTLLFDFYNSNTSIVSILPTESDKLSNNIFDGFFDGATWGMYLTGTDPRNQRGWSYIHRNQGHHKINTGHSQIEISNELIYIRSGSEAPIPLFNLHIHSKKTRLFEPKQLIAFLSSKKNQNNLEYRHLDIPVFIRATADYLVKKWKNHA